MRNTLLAQTVLASMLALSSLSYALPTDHAGLQFQIIESQIMFDKSKIESVTAVENADNTYSLAIKLTSEATDEMQAFTRAHIGKKVNTVLNGKIISLTTIQTELGGSFLIAEFATKAQAEKAGHALSQSK